MNKVKSCAGCFCLFKKTNNGYPYVYCYLRKQTETIKIGIRDKRLDIDVFIKPINKCKVTNGTQFIKLLN